MWIDLQVHAMMECIFSYNFLPSVLSSLLLSWSPSSTDSRSISTSLSSSLPPADVTTSRVSVETAVCDLSSWELESASKKNNNNFTNNGVKIISRIDNFFSRFRGKFQKNWGVLSSIGFNFETFKSSGTLALCMCVCACCNFVHLCVLDFNHDHTVLPSQEEWWNNTNHCHDSMKLLAKYLVKQTHLYRQKMVNFSKKRWSIFILWPRWFSRYVRPLSLGINLTMALEPEIFVQLIVPAQWRIQDIPEEG